MAVERQFGDAPERLDHGRTEGDVGNEVAIHHIDVDDSAAAALGRCDLVGQVREVRCKNRKCQFNHADLLL